MKTKTVVIGVGILAALGGAAWWYSKKNGIDPIKAVKDVALPSGNDSAIPQATIAPGEPSPVTQPAPVVPVVESKPVINFVEIANKVFSPTPAPVPVATPIVESKSVFTPIVEAPVWMAPGPVTPVIEETKPEVVSPIAFQPVNYSQPMPEMINTSSGGYSNGYIDYNEKDYSGYQNFSGLRGVLF